MLTLVQCFAFHIMYCDDAYVLIVLVLFDILHYCK